MESETWEERFNALLCEYLNEKFDLNAVQIVDTYSVNSPGCDTCDYGSFYGTNITYVHENGRTRQRRIEVDLNELIG